MEAERSKRSERSYGNVKMQKQNPDRDFFLHWKPNGVSEVNEVTAHHIGKTRLLQKDG